MMDGGRDRQGRSRENEAGEGAAINLFIFDGAGKEERREF